MRKLFLHFAVTADGMVSNVEQWVSFTDEAMKDSSAWHDTVDTIIFGNNNYAPLAGYWQDAETSANSADERLFAKKVNDMHKLVLSHNDVELVWKNSELLRVKDSATFKQAIARLKDMPGKNITAEGTLPAAFSLQEAKTSPTGVLLASYKRAGEVQTGSFWKEKI